MFRKKERLGVRWTIFKQTALFRCLESESECEKVREKTKEMRRKLDDTQAALQELGRENQTFQVDTVTQ